MANKCVQLKSENDNVYTQRASIIYFSLTPVSGVTIERQSCWYEPDSKRVVINAMMTSSEGLTGDVVWATIPHQYQPQSIKYINAIVIKTGEEFCHGFSCYGYAKSTGVGQDVTQMSTSALSLFGEYYI